jgi:hypothetical protein
VGRPTRPDAAASTPNCSAESRDPGLWVRSPLQQVNGGREWLKDVRPPNRGSLTPRANATPIAVRQTRAKSARSTPSLGPALSHPCPTNAC